MFVDFVTIYVVQYYHLIVFDFCHESDLNIDSLEEPELIRDRGLHMTKYCHKQRTTGLSSNLSG